MMTESRDSVASLRNRATSRNPRSFTQPLDNMGQVKKVSEYFGELTFDFKKSEHSDFFTIIVKSKSFCKLSGITFDKIANKLFSKSEGFFKI